MSSCGLMKFRVWFIFIFSTLICIYIHGHPHINVSFFATFQNIGPAYGKEIWLYFVFNFTNLPNFYFKGWTLMSGYACLLYFVSDIIRGKHYNTELSIIERTLIGKKVYRDCSFIHCMINEKYFCLEIYSKT